MVPVVVLTAKSLLLYSVVPWLVSGVALSYMGKHFGTQIKSNPPEMKRQKQEIQQLRALHREQEDQIRKLQAKLAETSTNKPTKLEQPLDTRTFNRHAGQNKVIFLRNLLEANMRLREDIQNEAYTAKPVTRTANEK